MTPRYAATLLLVMTAMVDGEFHEDEADRIRQWTAAHCDSAADPGQIYCRLLQLDRIQYMNSFVEAVDAVRRLPAPLRRELSSALFDVVLQDSKVAAEEQGFYKLLQELLKSG